MKKNKRVGSPSIAARYNLKANMKESTYDYTNPYPSTNCRMQSPFVKGGQGDFLFNYLYIKILQITPQQATSNYNT
jgi:hypothetical protein